MRYWLPPLEGYAKVNTDANLRPQFGPKGIGGIIRNATGNCAAGFMASMRPAFNLEV